MSLFCGLPTTWVVAVRHPAFVVEVVRLAECPNHLRAEAAAVLDPLIGQTFFDVRSRREALTAQLAALAEVSTVQFECRPPDTVEVRIRPRVPTLAVQAGERWFQVDDEGVIVRLGSAPEAGLPQVYGLTSKVSEPGWSVGCRLLTMANECVAACVRVLGSKPVALRFEDGAAMRLQTADGSTVVLGQVTELEQKLRLYLVLRRKLPATAAYVDVSAPAAPFWQPVG